jgi:hypothetical protein
MNKRKQSFTVLRGVVFFHVIYLTACTLTRNNLKERKREEGKDRALSIWDVIIAFKITKKFCHPSEASI